MLGNGRSSLAGQRDTGSGPASGPAGGLMGKLWAKERWGREEVMGRR